MGRIVVPCLVLLLNMILSVQKCHGHLKIKTVKEQKALFVFGDSLYDPGNNVYIKGINRSSLPTLHWPYGETYFKHPTGRYSDGRLVPDFIATLVGLPILSPYLQPHPTPFTYGANFASAGAGVLLSVSDLSILLPTQFSYFKDLAMSLKRELGNIEAERVLGNGVYLISIGGNDYNSFQSQNPNATNSDRRAFVDLVITKLIEFVKAIYDIGGRNIAYQNVAPLGCTPQNRVVSSGACDPQLMELARQHNQAFSKALKKLGTKLPEFRYSLFDYYNALYDRVNDPLKYGFKEGKIACCGVGPFRRSGCGEASKVEVCSKPSQYVWFDSAHQVERVNLQMATLLWNAPPTVTGPYNLKQLFGY